MAKVSSTIELDGGKTFAQALRDIANQAKLMDSEMRKAVSSVEREGDAEKKAQAQTEALTDRIKAQREIVARLRAVMDDAAKQTGENSQQTQKARIAYNDAVTALNGLESQLDDTTGATKDYSKETADAGKKTSDTKDKIGKAASVIGNVAVTIGKAAAAIGAAAGAMAIAAGAALTKIVKSSVDMYGELEQNLGGSEAVFGEFADAVQKKGEEAYRTMGVTQSEYLATANKMGALFQGSGVDIERSMELSTQAMQRATDMASVMGIDVNDALQAVTGAAKGNYTMMDNLGVAMNATTLEAYAVAQGMDTAFKDMTNAEKAELAMQYFFEKTSQYAGNFEKEASTTISGSFGLLQASVQSLVAGMGNSEADIKALTQNVVDALMLVVQNVQPVIEAALGALPTIVAGIGQAITENGPAILTAVESILGTLMTVLNTLMPTLIPIIASGMQMLAETLMAPDNLSAILTAAGGILVTIVSGLVEHLPEIIDVAMTVVMTLVDALMSGDNLGKLIEAAIAIIMRLASGLIENLPTILSAAEDLIGELLTGLANGLPDMMDMAVQLVLSVLQGLTKPESLKNMIRGALRLVVELARGLIQAIPQLVSALPDLIASVVKTLIELAPELIVASIELIGQLIVGLVQAIPLLVKMIPDIINSMKEAFTGFDWASIGKDIMEGVKNGISSMISNLVSTVKNAASELLNSAKKALGIGSPSKEFAKVGKYMGEGLDIGMTKSFKTAAHDMERELEAMPMQASATLTAATASGTTKTTNYGGVSINVYGAEGQDARQIAREVERIFMSDLRTKEAAFA